MSVEELVATLVPMGSSPKEIHKMFKIADLDGDGEVCARLCPLNALCFLVAHCSLVALLSLVSRLLSLRSPLLLLLLPFVFRLSMPPLSFATTRTL